MRRILVVTSGRADASPLKPVIDALGVQAVSMSLEGQSPETAVGNVTVTLERDYDAMLVLGDRFEILGACLAATVARIPIAHIHGGEASFGSFDNQIRDAITKLAHIHFVAAEPMRERLLALGEEPHRIHVVGAPGLDLFKNVLSVRRKTNNTLILTYHPPTLGEVHKGAYAIVEALKRFSGARVVWTDVNNDPGWATIKYIFRISGFIATTLGEQFLPEYRQAAAIIGNSSSGIIEAPYLEVPTVNIGSRQDGRLKGRSIIDCPENADAIEQAILRAIKYDGPYDRLYGEPGASAKITAVLKDWQPDMVKRWVS